jgi:hypothetical protein
MQYVEDLIKSKTRATRVEGLRKLCSTGIKTPFVKIVNHKAFLGYKKEGMTKPLQKKLEAVFFEIKMKDPKRNIYVGRAYFVPDFPNPPGPRFVVGDVNALALRVADHFDFAIQNRYDKKKGSQIGVILHPWINPRIPLGGGCITLAENGPKKIIIEAIYGIDEGVQGFPHDFYIVDFNKNKIIERVIAEKKECLEVDSKIRVSPVSVPKNYWHKQVLEDKTILDIAHDFKRFVKKYGPHRLEYAYQREGVYFRECVPFVVGKERLPEICEKGEVFRLNTKSDLPKIGKRQRIIFVDPIVIKKRQMNLLTFLATNTHDKKIILYPGSATTGHMATIFRETGHLVVFVGDEIFKDGEKITVKTQNRELIVQRL